MVGGSTDAATSSTGAEQFHARLQRLHRALGIPADYMETCKLPLCPEPDADELVATEPDFRQRPQRLLRAAFKAWTDMKKQAARDGVELFLISAFRGIDYQHDLIAAKLQQGRSLRDVLAVNAAPGFSEHHSGCAIDLGTPGCGPLLPEFEHTPAFHWLGDHAAAFGFRLSYPRGNPFGIAYEPWHWCYRGAPSQTG